MKLNDMNDDNVIKHIKKKGSVKQNKKNFFFNSN